MSAGLLSMPNTFYLHALKMIDVWRIAAEANLSNVHRNRQAWIGQATACFFCGSAEHHTKEAWHTLSESERVKANEIADQVIRQWESVHA